MKEAKTKRINVRAAPSIAARLRQASLDLNTPVSNLMIYGALLLMQKCSNPMEFLAACCEIVLADSSSKHRKFK
jgi:hypothetical protein